MSRIAAVALCAGLLCGVQVWANNILVTNATVSSLSGGNCTVGFDIQWENSWRCDQADTNQTAPHNYDAAWVFVKFGTTVGDWKHASLSTNANEHITPAGCALAVGLTGTNGAGVFLYRGTNGGGTFAANGVGLQWNYAADGVANGAAVTVKVCAIEMVYVPQGAFYVGDSQTDQGQFCEGGGTSPFSITNENALTNANTAGNLYSAGTGTPGDRTGVLSNAFPKGYGAFYGMKYEISQGQYADFLNTMSVAQAATRYPGQTTYRHAVTNVSGVYSSSKPYVACNFLAWADLAAYLDWAALRPLTELEFEKACRGTNAWVAGEYAWGNVSLTQATGITNDGQTNEVPSNGGANCVCASGVQGPMRVGCLGIGSGLRVLAGAGYYGMMELSGNLWERPVTVGNTTGRSFTGLHGDGALADTTGDANVTAWPGTDANGVGFRVGNWFGETSFVRAADRYCAANVLATRDYSCGGRGVRSAP